MVSIIGWAGAAAIFAAAVTYALLEKRITVDEPPPWVADSSSASIAANLERHYAWFATTLGQERIAVGLLLVGLLVSGAIVVAMAARLPESPLRQLGLVAALSGLVGWAFAVVALVGAHRAIEQMAASGNPIETVNAIAFTVDTQTSLAQGVAAAAIGVGLVLLAVAGASSQQWTWVALTFIGGAALVVLGVMKLAEQDEMWVQVAIGVLVLPGWLVVSGRVVSRSEMTEGVTDEEANSYATGR